MAIRSTSANTAPEQNTARVNANERSSGRKRQSLATRLLAISCLGLAAIGSTGCVATNRWCRDFQECIDESMVDYTNRALAEKAWFRHKHLYCEVQYLREFKDGFIQGYLDVATGGNGCTPLVAPSQYWGWRYQSPHGQTAVNAWFRGFPLGVKAAEEDGVGHWQNIPTSGVNQLVNPLAPPIYGNGVNDPFAPNVPGVPVPEPVIEGGETLDALPLDSPIEEIEIPEPQPLPEEDLSTIPTIESPSDETELVLGSAASDSEAIRATFGDESTDGPDDTTVFGVPANGPVQTESNELPFKFE